MNALSLAAALGLLGLVIGVVLVNVVSTPRAAQIGTIIAGVGVLMLAVTAIGQLFS
jgi:Na+/phosphate symporter